MRIVVLGAAGQLGREVVGALAARKYAVRAVVRRSPIPTLDSSIDVQIADAQKKVEIRQALSGCDAVVNAIGAGTLRRNDVESTTTSIAVAAAEEAGVLRYIAMSAEMVALDWFLFTHVLQHFLRIAVGAEGPRRGVHYLRGGFQWILVPRVSLNQPQNHIPVVDDDADI